MLNELVNVHLKTRIEKEVIYLSLILYLFFILLFSGFSQVNISLK